METWYCDEFEVLYNDTVACNYNNSATDDDGSCTFAETYYDCNGICINDSDGDMVCDEEDNVMMKVTLISQIENMCACDYDDGIGI